MDTHPDPNAVDPAFPPLPDFVKRHLGSPGAAPPNPTPVPILPEPAPGRVLHNTDPASHARWAEFDRRLAAGELRVEDQLPPSAEGVNGATPERTMVERYVRRHPHTVFAAGQFYRLEAGRWSLLPLDRFHYEIHAIVDHARASGDIPRGSVYRLHSLIAERVRLKLATLAHAAPTPATLPLANGLLDLVSAQLQPLNETIFVPHALPYAFDPAAPAPVWHAFLQARLSPVAAFLQEFAGLALTTDTRFETALWLYGPPGSGKSTFLHGLQVLLGPRCGVLNLPDLLAGQFSPVIIENKTLLVCSEPAETRLTQPARFNAFVSGEPLTVKPNYRRAEIIQPSAKLAWAFTTLPTIPDPHSPLFRRVLIVPFAPLPKEQQDVSLKSRLAAEGPGLLNWAITGLQRLLARGRFDPPPAVLAATEQFHHDNDLPALFLDDCCQRDPEQRVQSQRLHDRYLDWCRANGYHTIAANRLARHWERLGLECRRIEGRSFWFGVRLKGA